MKKKILLAFIFGFTCALNAGKKSSKNDLKAIVTLFHLQRYEQALQQMPGTIKTDAKTIARVYLLEIKIQKLPENNPHKTDLIRAIERIKVLVPRGSRNLVEELLEEQKQGILKEQSSGPHDDESDVEEWF